MAIEFGKMIGPLPLGAWLGLVGGGVAFAWYSNRSGSGTATESDSNTVGDSTDETLLSGTGGSGMWTDITTPTTGSSSSADGGITDNDSWARAAINYLIASGYDATVSDSAIRKYLAGAALSTTESALVRAALNRLGATPTPLGEPLFNPTPLPTPTVVTPTRGAGTGVKTGTPTVLKPTPAVTVATPKTYTVVKGDSLSKIAAAKLGNSAKWREIYNLNKGKIGSNPNVIKVGMVLTLP